MAGKDFVTKAAGSLQRYRVMAWVTGVMLLVTFAEWYVKDGLHAVPGGWDWVYLIPQVHGFVYIVYLIVTFDLWSTMRWRWGRLVTMALGGVVPFMSFVVERRVHADGEAQIAEGRPAPRVLAR